MKTTLFISILMLSLGTSAQSDTLNQIDSEGKKQGYWIIYGKDEPQKGYPENGKIQEGTYLDDRKNGRWILYHKDGVSVKIKGVFENGRPKGPYEKYYQNGNLMEKGTFTGRMYIGYLTAYWENGNLKKKLYFNEHGKTHNKAVYYFENGQLELEMKYNNGIIVDTIKSYYPSGELRYMAILDSLGKGIEEFTGPQTIRDSLNWNIFKLSPNKEKITIESHESYNEEDTLCFDKLDIDTNEVIFKPDGYNKLYTNNKNLFLDGVFKNGCLWDGKYYIYDNDGLLLKIKIYKKGRYFSDGIF